LVLGFKSKDFELQTKVNFGLNKGFRTRENLNSTYHLNSKKDLSIFEERKRNKEGFEFLSEIKNLLGSEMRFESTDLIQVEGYSKSRQGLT
jgi:hypothetical protein